MTRAERPKLGYLWHLRRLMAEDGMYATTALRPLLIERGIQLSEAQVYRLVTGTPERLSLKIMVALCDILGCTPNDLVEPVAETSNLKATGTKGKPADVSSEARTRTPVRAEIAKNK